MVDERDPSRDEEEDENQSFDEDYVDDADPAEYSYEGGRLREVAWDAPEHRHIEKGSDWYWALGILVVVGAVTMIIVGNALFGIVILLAGLSTALLSSREPRMITYSVSLRGIRIGNELHPYSTLRCFFLDEDHPHTVQLLVASRALLTPLLVIPVPDDAIEDIEYLLEARLPEEHLEEPLGHKVLEFLGF